MNLKLVRASRVYKDVIKNLMLFYMYDFSEFVDAGVEEDGLLQPIPIWKIIGKKDPGY